jgi:hypothetical protein
MDHQNSRAALHDHSAAKTQAPILHSSSYSSQSATRGSINQTAYSQYPSANSGMPTRGQNRLPMPKPLRQERHHLKHVKRERPIWIKTSSCNLSMPRWVARCRTRHKINQALRLVKETMVTVAKVDISMKATTTLVLN